MLRVHVCVYVPCSDGLEYPFLAKPKDDLRKDYRLMDFAGTLNALLARTPGELIDGLHGSMYALVSGVRPFPFYDCGVLSCW